MKLLVYFSVAAVLLTISQFNCGTDGFRQKNNYNLDRYLKLQEKAVAFVPSTGTFGGELALSTVF